MLMGISVGLVLTNANQTETMKKCVWEGGS